jgi:HD-like signal output (HDOD) protein
MSHVGSCPDGIKKILQATLLPALPHSAIRLLELSQDRAAEPVEFALPIESDPGLAGQVLRFVNSSYFGFSREISTVRLAIAMVGTRTIKNFVLWNAVFSLIPNPKCGPFDLKMLWQDSLRRALFARAFGKILGMKEAEEPFTAALLQDMAIPLLARALPDTYVKLLEARQKLGVRLSALEERGLGGSHAQAGALIARQWNLPEQIAELIEGHLDIEPTASAADCEPARLAVSTSSLLPTVVDTAWNEAGDLEDRYQKTRPEGSLPLGDILEQVDREFADFAPILKIANPKKSLADHHREAVALTPG